MKEEMRYIVRRTEATGRYHILNAPSVVAAIAVKNMRRIVTNGKNKVTISMIKYHTFDFAAESVKNYTRTNKPIIQTNQPYPRAGDTDQAAAGESIQEPDELEKQMVSDIICVEKYFMSKNQAGLMLQGREFEAPYAKPRHPPGGVTVVTHTITRMQAVAHVEPLIQRILDEPWQDALNDELASKLTEETVAVLFPAIKTWLATWARQASKPLILERLQRCIEDKTTHHWKETQRRPGQALWSATSSGYHHGRLSGDR